MRLAIAVVFSLPLLAADTLTRGDELARDGQWANALKAYQAVLQDHPDSGAGWFKAGIAFGRLGRENEAIDSFKHAIEHHFQAPGAMVRIAAANARKGETKEALAWLDRAAQAGFAYPGIVRNDPALTKLNGAPEFQKAVEQMEISGKPCSHRPEFRQFDFWIGQWDVEMGGQKAGANRIDKSLDGCLL